MYTYKLALLALGATAVYAYPAASKNSESLAFVAARPEQKMPRTIENPRAATLRVKGDHRRQIHNADYQANGPPPSPNPGPAQESSSPSPANPAPSEPVPKDKHSDSALWRGVSSPPRSLEKPDKELDVEKGSVTMKTRSMPYNTADRDTWAPNKPPIIENPDVMTHRVEADEKRQIHNADYQANGPPPSPNPGPAQESSSPSPANPAPSESVPKDKRSDSALWRGSGVSSPSSSREIADKELDVEKSNVVMKTRSMPYPGTNTADRDTQARNMPRITQDPDAMTADEKRQIHNADYQANGPPSSPNPAPAQESSSPANSPAAAPSESAPKDKRNESSFEHGIIPSSSPVEKSSVAIKKRSMDGPAAAFGDNVINHRASKLVSRTADGEWYGRRRRNVEELTNIHNRNLDHDTVTRWSRAEVDKMQAQWSKFGQSNV